jgi:hypothetical protein
MSVEPPYSVCLTWESSTIILDSSHSFAFTAQVDHFDIQKGIVELSELNPIDGGFGTKEMTRVEPDDPIPVKISNKEISIIGEMLDVSITDIGIRVNSLGEPPLGSGDMVQLALIVMGKNAGSSGTVVSIQPQGSTYRLGIRFTLEETVPDLLARYITHRRAEIHRELLDAYNTARGNGVNK